MLSEVWNKIKELVRKMITKKDIENVLNTTPIMSDKMANAIELWSNLYEGRAPWLHEPNDYDRSRVVSLGLPALIASEKARMATLEMKSEITAPMQEMSIEDANKVESPNADESKSSNPIEDIDEQDGVPMNKAFDVTTEQVATGPTERADFLQKQYKKVLKQIRKQLEYGIAKGGLVIKPYVVMYEKDVVDDNTDSAKTANIKPDEQKIETAEDTSKLKSGEPNQENPTNTKRVLDRIEMKFDYVQADRFFPLSFDSDGKIVEAAFIQTKTDKILNKVFIRLEHHKLVNHKVTVNNLAFESTNMNLANTNNIRSASNLGNPINLNSVPEWANLKPTIEIDNVDRLLLSYFRMPEANTIDPYSPLGVSGYSRVTRLIKDADEQYSRMLWEFEGGELAIDVDSTALDFVNDPATNRGHSVLPKNQNRLFRKVDLNNEETYEVFSPALRDESIVHGLNVIFMRIEDATGLSRGTLSDVNVQEAKTATELKILKQRSFATNRDIQMALQDALEDLVYVMDVYCTLYSITPEGEYEISFEWDDSIIVDSESELTKRLSLMQNGISSKVETRMWYFGETENQARAALQQVDKEAQQAMVQNANAMALQAQLGLGQQDEDGEDNKKSPADKTSDKKSKGKQADSLENPNKSKDAKAIKEGKK